MNKNLFYSLQKEQSPPESRQKGLNLASCGPRLAPEGIAEAQEGPRRLDLMISLEQTTGRCCHNNDVNMHFRLHLKYAVISMDFIDYMCIFIMKYLIAVFESFITIVETFLPNHSKVNIMLSL